MKHFNTTFLILALLFASTAFSQNKTTEESSTPIDPNQTFNQKVNYDWSKIGSYIATTTVNGMQFDKKTCGATCENFDLAAKGTMKDGSFVFHVREKAGVENHCEVNYDVPFIILEGYLVTRLVTYDIKWESIDGESCPNNTFVLKVDGDPTEPSGYKITLAAKEIKVKEH